MNGRPSSKRRLRTDITPTKLRDLQICPRRAYFRHLLGWEDPGSDHFEVGRIVHAVLATLARRRLRSRGPAKEQAVESAEVLSVLEDHGDGSPRALGRARDILEQLTPDLSFAHTLAANEHWQFDLGRDEESGWTIVAGGRWDRVDRLPDGTIRLVDYRTGRVQGRTELRVDDGVGLRLAAARARWPDARVESLVWWVDRDVQVTVPWTSREDEFARIRARIGYRQLRRGDDTPRVESHCASCPYRGRCEAYQEQLRRLEAAPSPNTADQWGPRRILEERERLKRVAALAEGARRDLDELIRKRMNGRIELRSGDLRARVITRRLRGWSPRVVPALAQALERDPIELMEELGEIRPGKLKALLSDAPDAARRLAEAHEIGDATEYLEVRQVAPFPEEEGRTT